MWDALTRKDSMILQHGGLSITVQHVLFPSDGMIRKPGVILRSHMDDGFMVDLAFAKDWFDEHITEACHVFCEAFEGWKTKRKVNA